MKKEPSLQLKEITKASFTPDLFTTVNCPSCQEPTGAAEININDQIAKCNHCNVVFSIQPSVQHLLTVNPASKQELLRPEGIDLFYFRNELDISLPKPVSLLSAILTPLLFLIALILTLAFFKSGTMNWMIPVASWIATLIPAYDLILWKRNKIFITVNKDELSIIRGKNQIAKDKHYSVGEVNQLFVRQRDGLYDLMLVINTPGGARQVPLIRRFHNLTKARFLEQEIEKYLGIKNRSILEEIK